MILWMIAASGVTATQVEQETAVRAAIVAAVEEQAGPSADVTLDLRVVQLSPGKSADEANIEPGARFGRPSRFRLLAAGRSVGYAVAVVHVTLRHVVSARAIAAGDTIGPDDLREAVGELGGMPIESLPRAGDVVGGRSSRAIAAGEVITSRLVRIPPAVRSGDVVSTRIVVEGVEAVGVATALQSGSVGDVIRLVNPESRRQLRGRVIGRGAVEVQNES